MDAIPLGRIAGFPVRANWSVLILLWLFAWSLASTLPSVAPGYTTTTYWWVGMSGALVLLGSLLAHEITHAAFARRAGVKVVDVTLWLFGGVTRLGGEANTPTAAFAIAASGPLTSLAIATTAGVVGYCLGAVGVPTIVVGATWWLAAINLALGVFNLLPGAPLDGGRVLQAYLWHRTGDPVRASVRAARAGRVLALILIALGLADLAVGETVGGMWLAFLGWVVFDASRDEEVQVKMQHAMAGVRVGDVMTVDPHTVRADVTVEDFIQKYVLGDRHSAYPVTDGNGSLVGLIGLAQLRRIPADRRASTSVRSAATPLSEVPTATPSEPLTALLQRLGSASSGNRVLVLDDGRLVGIVTSSDLTRLVEVYTLAGVAPR